MEIDCFEIPNEKNEKLKKQFNSVNQFPACCLIVFFIYLTLKALKYICINQKTLWNHHKCLS